MRALLDTHVWLWLLAEPERLEPSVRDSLRLTTVPVFLSVASVWEVAIKHSLGKLDLPFPLEEFSATELPIASAHALRAGTLPSHHRDPFDRMLVAQAMVEELTLVSADPAMAPYGVDLLRASH